MNFEELQQGWKQQPVNRQEDITAITERIASQAAAQKKKILRGNVRTTFGFAVALYVFGRVFLQHYKEADWFFGGSIFFMSLLLLVYLWVIWKGMPYRKLNTGTDNEAYIAHYVAKLEWQRKVIMHYRKFYAVLLWAALMVYLTDVTAPLSLPYRILAPVATTTYIVGVMALTWRFQQKKQLQEIDGLLANLRRQHTTATGELYS